MIYFELPKMGEYLFLIGSDIFDAHEWFDDVNIYLGMDD